MKTGMSKANARQGLSHKKFYDAYRNEGRHEISKARRIAKHAVRYGDRNAVKLLAAVNPLHLRRAGVSLAAITAGNLAGLLVQRTSADLAA